jgi:hypothetical protein
MIWSTKSNKASHIIAIVRELTWVVFPFGRLCERISKHFVLAETNVRGPFRTWGRADARFSGREGTRFLHTHHQTIHTFSIANAVPDPAGTLDDYLADEGRSRTYVWRDIQR